jgi:hypothetical protein
VPVDSSTCVIPPVELDPALYIKVNHTNDTAGAQQRRDRVDYGVELGDHGKGVAHCHELGTTGVSVFIEVSDDLASRDHGLALVGLRFVLVEAEGAGVLADDLDVLPSEAGEALARHVAETGGEVDDV